MNLYEVIRRPLVTEKVAGEPQGDRKGQGPCTTHPLIPRPYNDYDGFASSIKCV